MKLNPEQLITFSVVAEYGSVSRAAEALHLSQSAVSGQLSALQEQIGKALYQRAGRGITLTTDGEELLPYANAIAHSLRQATQQVQGMRERPSRVMKVGLSPVLARWAARMMVEAERQGLHLRLIPSDSSDLVRGVETAEMDAALAIGPLTLPVNHLDAHPLVADRLRLMVPVTHRLAGRQSVPLHEAAGETFLVGTACSSMRLQTDRLMDLAGLRAERVLEVGSLCAMRDGLLDGYGVTIMPRIYLAREIDSGLLACLEIESTHTDLSYVLLTPPAPTQGPPERRLTEFLLGMREVVANEGEA